MRTKTKEIICSPFLQSCNDARNALQAHEKQTSREYHFWTEGQSFCLFSFLSLPLKLLLTLPLSLFLRSFHFDGCPSITLIVITVVIGCCHRPCYFWSQLAGQSRIGQQIIEIDRSRLIDLVSEWLMIEIDWLRAIDWSLSFLENEWLTFKFWNFILNLFPRERSFGIWVILAFNFKIWN